MPVNRRDFLQAVGATAVALTAPTSFGDQTPPKQPNIIMLVADDHRGDAMGFLGHPDVKTPHMDDMAAKGTSFPKSFNMGGNQGGVCVPARAMIHQGRPYFRAPDQMKGNAVIGETLHQAGYDTFAAGKWHNGANSFQRSFASGATIFFGGMSQDHNHTPIRDYDPSGKYPDSAIRKTEKFDTEVFADSAIDFLKHRADKGNDKPFFLYVAFTTPHDPRDPPKEYRDHYDPAKLQLPGNFLPDHPFDNGEMKIRDELLLPRPLQIDAIKKELQGYYGLITLIDDQIGRIRQTLDEIKLSQNTILIYTGDHGLSLGSHGLLGKQNLYQEALSTPFLIVGPGIPAGKRSDAMVLKQDYFPTLCDLTGTAKPATVQGQSFAGEFTGQSFQKRDSIFAGYRHLQRGYFDGQWKFIQYQVNGVKTVQLFDLKNDPLETKNLAAAAENKQDIERLAELMHESQKRDGDNLKLL
jgi:arylsulfatase A-like enzyme